MQRLKRITLAPADQDDDAIAQSQTPGGAGNLTLNGVLVSGGVATLPQARRVAIAGGSDESGKTFTITGTDRKGRAITDTVTGPNNSTVYSAKDFLTVSNVAVSAGTTGAVKVGTGGKISSAWVPVDRTAAANLGFGVKVTGTVNYTVEHSFDDPFSAGVGVQSPSGVAAVDMTAYPNATIASKTDNQSGWYTGQPISAVRITMNTYTNGAQVEFNLAPGFVEGR